MKEIYKYGFTYKGFLFGWKNKNLIRLPTNKNNVNYPLKKLNKIKIGSKEGYRVVRDKKTIEQLKELTEIINYKHTVHGKNSPNTPF